MQKVDLELRTLTILYSISVGLPSSSSSVLCVESFVRGQAPSSSVFAADRLVLGPGASARARTWECVEQAEQAWGRRRLQALVAAAVFSSHRVCRLQRRHLPAAHVS